jgi:hypothetical protein
MAEQFGFVTTKPPDFFRQPGTQSSDVIGIHLGNHQRHILLHAQRAGIRNHGAASLGESAAPSRPQSKHPAPQK